MYARAICRIASLRTNALLTRRPRIPASSCAYLICLRLPLGLSRLASSGSSCTPLHASTNPTPTAPDNLLENIESKLNGGELPRSQKPPEPTITDVSKGKLTSSDVPLLNRLFWLAASPGKLHAVIDASDLLSASRILTEDGTESIHMLPAPLSGYPTPYVTDEDISKYIKPLYTRGWGVAFTEKIPTLARRVPQLTKRFEFTDFYAAIAFVNAVVEISRSEKVSPLFLALKNWGVYFILL